MIAFGLFLSFVAGIFATLWFQKSEASGRMHAHGRAFKQAWDKADEWEAKAVALEFRLKNEREEHETLWANMALAYDRAVHANDTVQQRRVATWKALDRAIHELHSNPDPKCVTCGDSIKVDDQCFVCGLHDEELPPVLRIVAQA